MSEPDTNPPVPQRFSPLGRAFLGWFVLGGAVYLVGIPLALSGMGFADIGEGPWLLGLPVFFLLAIVKVWRAGRHAGAWSRWAARLAVLASFVLFLPALVPMHTNYTVQSQVSEGVSLSNPARTAIGIACSQSRLAPGLDHAALGLLAPQAYAGPYTRSVQARVVDGATATVTVVMKDVFHRFYLFEHKAVESGQSLVYEAWCGPGGSAWSISEQSTVSARYRPKI